jgi:hypothetical protein
MASKKKSNSERPTPYPARDRFDDIVSKLAAALAEMQELEDELGVDLESHGLEHAIDLCEYAASYHLDE